MSEENPRRRDDGVFERLIWQKDRMILGDLVFRIQYELNDDWELGENCFLFFKGRRVLEEYRLFFSKKSDFQPVRIYELGIWDGGSIAFWFEYFRPRKYVAIDISHKLDSPYFKRYVRSRNLESRMKTYWRTNQGDANRLREIFQKEFNGPLDLVIDDASHVYELTKAGFETLFPLLRPGGLYIIEDWAWSHCPEHFHFAKTALTQLIFELVEVTGSCTGVVSTVTVANGFAAIERGDRELATEGQFRLEPFICRRPRISEPHRILSKFADTHLPRRKKE